MRLRRYSAYILAVRLETYDVARNILAYLEGGYYDVYFAWNDNVEDITFIVIFEHHFVFGCELILKRCCNFQEFILPLDVLFLKEWNLFQVFGQHRDRTLTLIMLITLVVLIRCLSAFLCFLSTAPLAKYLKNRLVKLVLRNLPQSELALIIIMSTINEGSSN